MKINHSYRTTFPEGSINPVSLLTIKNNLHFHFQDTLQERKRSKTSCCSWLSSLFYKIKNYFFPKKQVSKKKTRSPEKKKRKKSSCTHSYPKSYSHPVVGIIRKDSNNCCFNAILQGIVNIPSWRTAVEKIPPCRDFIDAYDNSLLAKKPVPKLYSDSIRTFLSENNKGNQWGKGQEDASEILMGLFNFSSSAPTFHLERIHRTDPSRLEEGTFLHLNRGVLREEIFMNLISDSFKEQTVFKKFIETPTEFTVYSSVFVPDENNGIIKNTLPMQGKIATITLSDPILPNQETAAYECDYSLIHEGVPYCGHYTCALKKEGQWYLIDDHKVRLLSQDQAENFMRTSTLLHYTRLHPTSEVEP